MTATPIHRNLAIIAAVLSTIASSIAWIYEKEAVVHLGSVSVASLAPLFGGALILLVGKVRGELKSPWLLLHSPRDVTVLLLSRYVMGGLLVTLALEYTQASKVIFLTKMEPYFVMLLGWFLYRAVPDRKHAVLLLVHIGGAILLSAGDSLSFAPEHVGDLILTSGILCCAISYRPAQRLANSVGSSTVAGYLSVVSGLLLLPIAVAVTPHTFSLDPSLYYGWSNLLATVLLFHFLGLFLWFYALRGLEDWLVSASRCLGPVFAAPVAWIFYSQPLTFVQIVGAAIVLLTSFLLLREKKKA